MPSDLRRDVRPRPGPGPGPRPGPRERCRARARPAFGSAALLLVLAAALSAGAHEVLDPMHRVSFQVERSREVANDWVRAVVGVSDEDPDPAALAKRVNESMAWALERARRATGVKAESGGYHTQPVHQDGRLRRWRAHHDLVLEGSDPDRVTALVGELQARLQLRSLEFTVSPDARRRVEDDLVVEALQAFQSRAALVASTLGASGHELVSVSVDTGGSTPRPYRRQMATRGMAEAAGVPPPQVEAGTTEIQVRAHGTIEVE